MNQCSKEELILTVIRELDGVTNANCWSHARRDYADAVKAIGKDNKDSIKRSIAYQALGQSINWKVR